MSYLRQHPSRTTPTLVACATDMALPCRSTRPRFHGSPPGRTAPERPHSWGRGVVHFDGAETEAVIIGTAIDPWSTDYVSHE